MATERRLPRTPTAARADAPLGDRAVGDSVLEPDVDPAAVASPAKAGDPTPNLEKTGEVLTRSRSRSAEITLLTVLAVLYTLYFARGFLLPIAFAVLLNFLLSPLIRSFGRVHVRPPLGAAVVVLGLIGAIAGGSYALAGPAQRWAVSAPASLQRAESKLKQIFRPVQQVQRTAEQVQKAAGAVGGGQSSTQQVVIREAPSFASRLYGTTERLAVGTLEVMILLYFLLAGGDLFLQKLIKVLPHFEDKVKAVEIARATESAVSAYLTTTLLVNIAEGIVVAVILWLLGMPSAPLWGAMIVLLEFIPYIGAATAVVVLGIAGLTAFDSVGRALMIPGSFLLVNIVQANIVTPLLQGHRLTLNPVAIFIGLAFFFFIWGIPGAFLAVPLLATLKILCDRIESLAAVGEFLGERDEEERRRVVRAEEV